MYIWKRSGVDKTSHKSRMHEAIVIRILMKILFNSNPTHVIPIEYSIYLLRTIAQCDDDISELCAADKEFIPRVI